MKKKRKPTNRARQTGRSKPAAARPPSRTAVTRTGAWKAEFLAALTRTCDVTRSCELAPVSRDTAYEHRDKDEAFAAAWDEALRKGVPRLADRAEEELQHRALEGLREPVLYQGSPCYCPQTPEGEWCHESHPRAVRDAKGHAILMPMYVAKKEAGTLFRLLQALRPEKYRERFQVTHDGKHDGPRTPAERASAAAAVLAEIRGEFGLEPGGAEER